MYSCQIIAFYCHTGFLNYSKKILIKTQVGTKQTRFVIRKVLDLYVINLIRAYLKLLYSQNNAVSQYFISTNATTHVLCKKQFHENNHTKNILIAINSIKMEKSKLIHKFKVVCIIYNVIATNKILFKYLNFRLHPCV